MSDPVMITLIIAVALLIVLFIFRRQLKDFIFSISKEQGINTEIHTHDPPSTSTGAPGAPPPTRGVSVSGNVLRGRDNTLDVEHDDATVDDNKLRGKGQTLSVAKPTPQALHLHQQITRNFNVIQLRALCQRLDINYDRLPGAEADLSAKTDALLGQIQQEQRLLQLIEAGRELHPTLSWLP
ncbi:MAG: hypothetical protein ACLFTI_08740 [Anaerolineales bacterium]